MQRKEDVQLQLLVSLPEVSALYPLYNTSPKAPDQTGMGSTALQLAAKMHLGWNIGNTMEAEGAETGWGNPQITYLIQINIL